MSMVRYEWICPACGTLETTTDRETPDCIECGSEMRRNWKVIRFNRDNLRREH